MDADTPRPRINPAQDEFDKTQAAIAAKRGRKAAQDSALNQVQPGEMLDGFPARS